MSSGKKREDKGDFLHCIVSPKGDWIYAVAEDNELYCFASESGQLEHVMKVSEREVFGIAHHAHNNILATFSDEGDLKLWKP